MELYMTKGDSLKFINAPHVWTPSRLGVSREELERRGNTSRAALGAPDSDRELLKQHFLFHVGPVRSTSGKGEEKNGRERRDAGEEQRSGQNNEDGGRETERRRRLKAGRWKVLSIF